MAYAKPENVALAALNIRRCAKCKRPKHADQYYQPRGGYKSANRLPSRCKECFLAYIRQRNTAPEWRAKRREYDRRPENRARTNARIARLNARRRLTPAFVVSERVRACIRSGLLRRGKWGGKTTRTEATIGYTFAELATHLERQFTKGMGWHNMGKWHIDHIVPVSAFDIKEYGDAEFVRCWSLPNLRPLWAEDNLRKSAAVLTLL